MRFCSIVLFCLIPTLSAAGPWPREKGSFYALVSHQGTADGWSGLYLEYGGPKQLTFGLDLGGHVVGLAELRQTGFSDQQVDGRVRTFVRIPVPLPRGTDGEGRLAPWLAAIELSIGREYEEDGRSFDRFGIGATVGRGFSTRLGDGWMTFDVAASTASKGETRTNIAAVAGIRPIKRLAVEIGLFAEQEENDIDYQIGPTIQYGFGRLGQGRFGIAYKSEGETAVTLGWAISY